MSELSHKMILVLDSKHQLEIKMDLTPQTPAAMPAVCENDRVLYESMFNFMNSDIAWNVFRKVHMLVPAYVFQELG